MSFAPVYALRDWGATGDGKTDDFDRVGVAQRAVSSGGLRVTRGTYLIGTSMTFSVPLFFDPGAVLKPANGVTLTVTAKVWAGLSKCFDLSAGGVVVFGLGSVDVLQAAWWGAVGDGVTDSTGGVSQALAAADVSAVKAVKLPPGVILVDPMSWPLAAAGLATTASNIELFGVGSAYAYDGSTPVSILRARSAGNAVLNLEPVPYVDAVTPFAFANYCFLHDFSIDGRGLAQHGLRVAGTNLIKRVTVVGFDNAGGCLAYGFRLGAATNQTDLEDCTSIYNTGWGLGAFGPATTLWSLSGVCNFRRNTAGGLYVEAGKGVRWDSVVCESNGNIGTPAPGLKIFSRGTVQTQVQNLTARVIHIEANVGMQLVIDALVQSGLEPNDLEFQNIHLSTRTGDATGAYYTVSSGLRIAFRRGRMMGAPAATPKVIGASVSDLVEVEVATDFAVPSTGVRCSGDSGTWVPTIANGHASSGAAGSWTRVGDRLFAYGRISVTATADASDLHVTLPMKSAADPAGGGALSYSNAGRTDLLFVNAAAAFFILYTAAGVPAREVDYSGKAIYFSLSYLIG